MGAIAVIKISEKRETNAFTIYLDAKYLDAEILAFYFDVEILNVKISLFVLMLRLFPRLFDVDTSMVSSSEKDPVDDILAQWHRERPDLDVSPMGLIGRMTRLASHLRKAIGKTFAEFGLQLGEFDVLATLRRSGAPYQLTPTELFKSMMVSSGTMTNRIDRLEHSGLVERIPDVRDRRGTLIQLTDKGLNLIDEAVTAHVENEHRILSDLSQQEKEALSDLLRKLLLSFEA